ncbi:hypothetical protein [Rhodococcus sp. USK13]|uniref:hypothetical protein n=1 Tax=Rhodococcus sp. USK13 TaxID=2806442 RepID=UPI002017085E|nr:hypothetical protein [Rhodococcus sp. USK13]
MNSPDTNDGTDHDPGRGIVDRLVSEFGQSFARAAICRMVTGSIRDLAGVPAADIPELAERLARQRLRTVGERVDVHTCALGSGDPVIGAT